MSPHSSIKDRTRETAEIEFNYNSVRYFNTRQWIPANSPGRLCGSVRTVSLEKELLGTSALAWVSGLPEGLRERSPLFPRNAWYSGYKCSWLKGIELPKASKKTGQMLENSVMHVKLFLRKTGNLRSRLIFALLVLIRPHYTIWEPGTG